MRRASCVAVLLLAAALPAPATVFEPREFGDAHRHERYLDLIEELRCLVCQNQSIAESDADLAADLRERVFEMIEQGESDEDILAYMTARYGAFVRYQPPFNAHTALLWGAPAFFALFAFTVLFFAIRRRRAAAGERAPAGE